MKTAQLKIRMTPEHLERVKAAAGAAGLSVSAWATERLLLCANQERVTLPPPVTARELAANLPGVEERQTAIAAVPPGPEIEPEHEALVIEVLGSGCLLCGEPGRVIPADKERFESGFKGPHNLQVLCDECAVGAGDLRDHEHLDAIQKAVQESISS